MPDESGRLTAAELVAHFPRTVELRSAWKAAAAQAQAAREREDAARRLYDQVGAVTEVFEGVPLRVSLGGNPWVGPLGTDLEYTRDARLSPLIRDEDDYQLDENGNLVWHGPYLLYLSGSGRDHSPWRVVVTLEEGLRMAKRFAAHGAVPGPPEEVPNVD